MNKDKYIKQLRELNVNDIRFLVEHGQKKQFLRSKKLEQFLSQVIDEVERELIEGFIRDIKDYQVPQGYGSASGGIGITAVTQYLEDKLSELKKI